ncbi:MAG: hypothetical protein L3J80_00565 [Thermoplasmata archaeon]|nr:hypothetical protein [Thermoplasmata archaeon]
MSNPGNDSVLVVNGSTRQLAGPPIPLVGTPRAIVYDPANGCVYVAMGNGLAIVQAATGSVIVANLSLGSSPPDALAVDPSPDRVVVSDPGDNEVWIVNGSNQSVSGPPLSVHEAGPIAFDPETGRAYLGGLSGVPQPLVVIDPGNDTVVNSSVGPALVANDLTYDSANGELYVTYTQNFSIVAIDPVTRQFTVIQDGMNRTESIVAAPTVGLVYVGYDGGFEVQALNSSTNQFETPILDLGGDYAPDGFHIGDLSVREPAAFDSATGWLYLTDVACEMSMATGQTYCVEPILAVHEDRLFPATFQEQGLRAGTSWTVTVEITPNQGPIWVATTHGTEVSFWLWNGTYVYYVSVIPDYAGPSSGNILVAGLGGPIAVSFQPFEFTVVLTELGLPVGSRWSVSAAGGPGSNTTSGSSNSTEINLELANGNYTIDAIAPGFVAASGPFRLTVMGGATTNTTILFASTSTPGPRALAIPPVADLALVVAIAGVAVGVLAIVLLLRMRRPPVA